MMAESSYCFYTPEKLIYRLICLLDDTEIEIHNVIDINCGQGAMLKAAKQKYDEAELIGVDIIDNDFYKSMEKCRFFHEDGFNYVKRCKKKYDIILSNPPFGATESCALSQPIKELAKKRIECQMLNANLSLMHDNSRLIIILPETFVNGASYNNVRKAIYRKYHVHCIVTLPDDTFGARRIKTYAILLWGHYCAQDTLVYVAKHIGEEWELEKKQSIPDNEVKEGRWGGKFAKTINTKIRIIRGNISSKDFCDFGVPVYHSAGRKEGIWRPSIRYVDSKKVSDRKAMVGDVIINRVGHSTGFWWINTENDYLISDCLFAVRGLKNIEHIFKEISVEGRLDIPLRGVASSYITQADVLMKLESVWREYEENETEEIVETCDCDKNKML